MSETKENVDILCAVRDPYDQFGTFTFFVDGTYTNSGRTCHSEWKVENDNFYFRHSFSQDVEWKGAHLIDSEPLKTEEMARARLFVEQIQLARAMREMIGDE